MYGGRKIPCGYFRSEFSEKKKCSILSGVNLLCETLCVQLYHSADIADNILIA